MVAIKEAGLNIPNDIAVVGYSDWAMAGVVEPALTTVSQPGFEMGSLAAKLLIEEIQYNNEENEIPYHHKKMTLKTEIKIRQSSIKKRVLAS
jgi:LacI family transcriptional regulator